MTIPWKRTVLTAIRIALIAIPLLTAAVVFPAIRLAALKTIGRAHHCSYQQAMDSFGVLRTGRPAPGRSERQRG
jgi:hypothetical protein